jgi:hypothetical protein
MHRRGITSSIYRANAISIELALLLITGLAGSIAQPTGVSSSHKTVMTNLIQADATAKLVRYMDATAASLDARPRAALTRIEGTGRQLLALRGYLRIEGGLTARWSWTAEEIKRFESSAEYRAALNEVEKVRRKFAELNPGYELYINTQVRELEKQIRFWNENRSVQVAADQLLADVLQELAGSAYSESPDSPGINRFRQFLKTARLKVAPTVATPGLSLHGQLRAFDFQVMRGHQLVAGTDSSSIGPVWDGQGWTKKLSTAVFAASNRFKGPLANPREPWHYDYVP